MQFTLVSYEVRVILIAQTLSDTVLTLNAIHSEEASYFMPCQILLYKTSFQMVMHESDSGMGMESGVVPFLLESELELKLESRISKSSEIRIEISDFSL